MNAIPECNGTPTPEPNRTELLTFCKEYKLQYKGYCFISVDKTKLSLVIKEENKEELLAPFSRKFIYSKNMLCIIGPKMTNDVALFFSKESACKKVYDIVVAEKANNKEYKPLEENAIKQYFNERFMSPLLDAFKNSTHVRLKEIVISMINRPLGNTVQENVGPQSLTNLPPPAAATQEKSDAMPNVDMKVEPLIPSKPIILAPIDLSNRCEDFNEALNENETPYNLTENDDSEDYDSDYELPAKKRKYSNKKAPKIRLLESNEFELLDLFHRKLMIFTSSEKNFFYLFSWHSTAEAFYCRGCKKFGVYIKAKVLKRSNEEFYVEMNEIRHKCEAIPYKPFNPLDKIVKNDNFELVKKLKNGKTYSMLIIFEGNERQMCRILNYSEARKLFYCTRCQRNSVIVEASVNKKEKYLQLGFDDHVCAAIQYSSIMFDKNKNMIDISISKQLPMSISLTNIISADFEIWFSINSGIKNYTLMVFHPDDKNLCYIYYSRNCSKLFSCYKCKRNKKSIWAKLFKNNPESYCLQFAEDEHGCKMVDRSSVVKNKKLLKKSNYDILIESETATSVDMETPIFTPAEVFGPVDSVINFSSSKSNDLLYR